MSKIDRLRVNAEYEEQCRKEQAEFELTIPKRMVEIQALASKLAISTRIELTDNGPILFIYLREGADDEESISYKSEIYEVKYIEDVLERLKNEKEEKAIRFSIAQSVWSKLTVEERVALKEHILFVR